MPGHTEVKIAQLWSDSLWPHGLYSPWTSPGQNTGMGSRSLLQGIFPIQGSNPCLPHCRQILYQLSHKGNHLPPIYYHFHLIRWKNLSLKKLSELPKPECEKFQLMSDTGPVTVPLSRSPSPWVRGTREQNQMLGVLCDGRWVGVIGNRVLQNSIALCPESCFF